MRKVIFIFMGVVLTQLTFSQQKYVVSGASKFIIEGTSNVHDWEEEVEKVNGAAEFVVQDGEIQDIELFRLEIKAKSIKSGKGLMDKKTYEALNADKYPSIIFKHEKILTQKKSGSDQLLNSEGILTISGSSKKITLTVKSKVLKDGSVQIEGEKELNMKDFGISPPTAMFGAISTGEKVTIKFNVVMGKIATP